MSKQLLLASLFAAAINTVPAQLMVNDQITANALVQEIFQGTGVTISNVTINGLPGSTMSTSMGNYTYEGVLPIPPAGILLTTGAASPNWGPGSGYFNDLDLMQLSGVTSVQDVISLEFDFVPEEDTMIFDFVFASQEYDAFTCSPFNDVFGFFLSGPGISGNFQNNAENIALVPNTQIPIAINTVNSGTSSYGDDTYCANADPNWQANNAYFVPDTSAAILSFNGMTVVLQAKYVLTPGATYHIKLAIADASDSVLDSGVFLQAGSFRSVGGLTTALEEMEQQRLNAWFNATGDLVIDAGDQDLSRVRLMDVQGRLIFDQHMRSTGTAVIDMEALTPGIYHVEALVNDLMQHTRIVRAGR